MAQQHPCHKVSTAAELAASHKKYIYQR